MDFKWSLSHNIDVSASKTGDPYSTEYNTYYLDPDTLGNDYELISGLIQGTLLIQDLTITDGQVTITKKGQ